MKVGLNQNIKAAIHGGAVYSRGTAFDTVQIMFHDLDRGKLGSNHRLQVSVYWQPKSMSDFMSCRWWLGVCYYNHTN